MKKQKLVIRIALFGVALIASALGLNLNLNQEGNQKASTAPSQGSRADTIADYQEARNVFWRQLYTKGGTTLYCGEAFNAGDRGGAVNIEHVFPMSWVTWKLKCGDREQCRKDSPLFNKIEADLHNLFPARKDINKIRRSRAFALINGEQRNFGQCDFEIDSKKNTVEPRDEVRGDIARAMFYMAEKYDLEIRRLQYQTLQQWSKQDPVSSEEQRRNRVISALQGNTNPFIDKQ